jgi:hypothetical protein
MSGTSEGGLGMSGEWQDSNSSWYILLVGLPRFESSFELAEGVVIRPIESPISVFDLAAAGGQGFKAWSALELCANSCTAEIESVTDPDDGTSQECVNRAWLANCLLVLRGFTKLVSVAYCGYSWNLIAGHRVRNSGIFHKQLAEEGVKKAVFEPRQTLPPFRGGLLDYHLQYFVGKGYRNDMLCQDDVRWIRSSYDTFEQLVTNSAAFRFALEASVDWRFSKEPRSAVARLWGGIEALFDVQHELAFRLAIYSACLLAERGEQRKRKYQWVKKLYDLRSKIVHGQELADEKIMHAMSDSFHLLRDLLLTTVDRGRLFTKEDFEDALFS